MVGARRHGHLSAIGEVAIHQPTRVTSHATHGIRPLIRGHRVQPPIRDPLAQAHLESFHQRQGRKSIRVVLNPQIVNVPAIASLGCGVAHHTKTKTQIGLVLPPGEVNARPGPEGRITAKANDRRPVDTIGGAFDRAVVTATELVFVPEAQDRPVGAGEVERDRGGGIGTLWVVAAGGVGEAESPAVGGIIGARPSSRGHPFGTERGLEVIGVAGPDRQGAGTGQDSGGGRRAVDAEAIHHEDAVVVVGVQEDGGVGQCGGVGIGDGADQRVVDADSGGAGAVDGVVMEVEAGVGGPGELNGLAVGGNDGGRGQRQRLLAQGDVVEMPAVAGAVAGIGGQSEAHEYGGLPGVGTEVMPAVKPAGDGAGVVAQGGPVRAFVDRDFGVDRVAAAEGVFVPVGERGQHCATAGEVDGEGEGQGLRADVVGVVAAGGVGPGVRGRLELFGAQGPGRVRRPESAARLAIVEEGVGHADESGDDAVIAGGGKAGLRQSQHLVVVGGLRADGHVGEGRAGAIGDLGDEVGLLPGCAGRHGAVDPVGGEVRCGRGAPGEVHAGAGNRRGGGERHGERRFGDDDIIQIPAVALDGGVGLDAEAEAEVGLADVGREVELFALKAVRLAGELRARQRQPGGPAVGRNLDAPVVVVHFQRVAVVEPQRRAGGVGQGDARGQADGGIHVVLVEGAVAIRSAQEARVRDDRRGAPVPGGCPVQQPGLEAVGEGIGSGMGDATQEEEWQGGREEA